MNPAVRRLSALPGNHWFGFHDVSAWSFDNDKIAALQIEDCSGPPDGKTPAIAGYFREQESVFVPVLETVAFNYPQGARQLWDPRGRMWVNSLDGEEWISICLDTSTEEMGRADRALYMISEDGTMGWSVNFSRLNRLGGYGYVGVPDKTRKDPVPANDGIWQVDLASGKAEMIVSIRDVAGLGEIGRTEGHHYLTHLVLSPSGQRILFLHRYWLPDGGLHNRLISMAVDGSDLQIHAEGFLSHFDWRDDKTVVIWGRIGSKADEIRRLPVLQNPVVRTVARAVKKMARGFMKDSLASSNYFYQIHLDSGDMELFWPELLQEDGHPMFNPGSRKWMVVDTYPDDEGLRNLKLINAFTGGTVNLGDYPMLRQDPDMSNLDIAFRDIDDRLVNQIGAENLAFWRSGIHCDLHPRWNRDGTKVCFDSIHEGSRQMYLCENMGI